MAAPQREGFREWNEDMARRYDPDLYHTQSPLPIRLLERRRVSVLLRLLAVAAGETVLEVGCGAGNVLERVVGARRLGVDLSDYLLGKARRRLGPDCALALMNAESLGVPDASFDKVMCTEVLEHVLEPRAVLAEMRRVTRPGGWVVVSVPNEPMIDALKERVFAIYGMRRLVRLVSGYEVPEKMADEWHIHEFDLDLLRREIDGLFRIAEARAIPGSFLPLRYVVKLVP